MHCIVSCGNLYQAELFWHSSEDVKDLRKDTDGLKSEAVGLLILLETLPIAKTRGKIIGKRKREHHI